MAGVCGVNQGQALCRAPASLLCLIIHGVSSVWRFGVRQSHLGTRPGVARLRADFVSGFQPSNFAGTGHLGLRPRLVCDALSALYGCGSLSVR